MESGIQVLSAGLMLACFMVGMVFLNLFDTAQLSRPSGMRQAVVCIQPGKAEKDEAGQLSDEEMEDMIAKRRSTRAGKTAGFCPGCGRPILQSDAFCPVCGKALK